MVASSLITPKYNLVEEHQFYMWSNYFYATASLMMGITSYGFGQDVKTLLQV